MYNRDLSKGEAAQIASTIITQLGGREFMVLCGVNQYISMSKGGCKFKLPRNKSAGNWCVVEYHPVPDVYSLVFGKVHPRTKEWNEVDRTDHVYCDQLRDLFEAKTGLYTSLRPRS